MVLMFQYQEATSHNIKWSGLSVKKIVKPFYLSTMKMDISYCGSTIDNAAIFYGSTLDSDVQYILQFPAMEVGRSPLLNSSPLTSSCQTIPSALMRFRIKSSLYSCSYAEAFNE